jgi:hypothetical protein
MVSLAAGSDTLRVVDRKQRLFEADERIAFGMQKPTEGGALHVGLLQGSVGEEERHGECGSDSTD